MYDTKVLKISSSFTSLTEEEMMCVEGGSDSARVNHTKVNSSQADRDIAYGYTLGYLSLFSGFLPVVGPAAAAGTGLAGIGYTISIAMR